MTGILVDTDVLIDYLRARAEAVAFLEGMRGMPKISTITVAELYAGVRDGEEREILGEFIGAFEVVPVDERIAVEAGLLRRNYLKSHNLGIADAIIAATALTCGSGLATLNTGHFPMIPDLTAPYTRSSQS